MQDSFSLTVIGLLFGCLVCQGCDGTPFAGPGGKNAQGSATSGWGQSRSTEQSRAAARALGVAAAKQAIAAGMLRVKDYPPPPAPPWQGDYIRLLRDRLQVGYEVPRLPAGAAEEDFLAEIRGWNETMTAEIERLHGAQILSRLFNEAMNSRGSSGGGGPQGVGPGAGPGTTAPAQSVPEPGVPATDPPPGDASPPD